MTATLQKPRSRKAALFEQVIAGSPSSPLRVDRDKGVIHGVKILGLESSNGRRYTMEAVARARKLYEGCPVNIDHPKKPTDSRSSYDRFGWLEGVQVKDDGLYGDLHVLKTHPMAERIMEAAEKNPSLFGLSHNAEGNLIRTSDGIDEVQEITEVRHVDLVADPATTRSLSESKKTSKTMTLRELIEQAKIPDDLRKALMEMGDDLPMDMAMPAPEPTATEGDWKADLVAAIGKLVQSESADDHALAKKIMGMLKPAAAATEDETKDKDGEEKDEIKEEDEEGKEKKEETKESIQRELVALKRKDTARDLCEAAGVIPTKVQLKALCALDDQADVKALIEEFKATATANSNGKKTGTAPRSNSAHRITEAQGKGGAAGGANSGMLKDYDSFKRGLFTVN